MTAKEAKKKTLYVWRYLATHPKVKSKRDLPKAMWNELQKYKGMCPLCEYHNGDCRCCILYSCKHVDGPYERWRIASTGEERQQAANELVTQVEAWEIGK
jgi:hypothetical protein